MYGADGVNSKQGGEWRCRCDKGYDFAVGQKATGGCVCRRHGGASRSTTYRLKAALTRASHATGRFLPP